MNVVHVMRNNAKGAKSLKFKFKARKQDLG